MKGYPISITVNVGLLDAFREHTQGKDFMSRPKRRRTQTIQYGRDGTNLIDREMSHVDRLQEKIEKLKHIDEVCFDHQAWAVIATDTNNFKVAHYRVLAAINKIDAIIERWAKALPDEEPRP